MTFIFIECHFFLCWHNDCLYRDVFDITIEAKQTKNLFHNNKKSKKII